MSKSTPTPIILDCTLRDGGYYNNWDFNIKFVNKYLQSMSDTGINFVEIGFRRVNLSSYAGECAYSTDTFLNKLIIPKNVKLGVMINAKEYLKNTKSLVNKNFLPANLSKVNFVRIAINFDNFQSAKVLVALLKKLGYKIGLNLMQSHGRDEPEYIDAAKKINDWGNVDMLYFADSFGNMYPNDVQHIVSSLQKGWKGDLGFHSHNNKSLALINCIESLKGGVVWCDGTILGMGRGAGNVTTEGLILETNKIYKTNYKLSGLIEILIDFQNLKDHYKWGSSLFYHLAAEKDIHPTYVQELLDDDRFKNELIPSYLSNIPREFISSFNSSAKEQLLNPYNKNFKKNKIKGKKLAKDVVLLGSGPLLNTYLKDIESFCIDNKFLTYKLNLDKEFINKKYVTGFILANYTRILFQIGEMSGLKKSLILPKDVINRQFPNIKLNNSINFDLVLGDSFHTQKDGCILKSDLTLAYAIAFLMANNVNRVFLAGFDGYEDLSRNDEVNQLLREIESYDSNIELVAITPTKYNLKSGSVYDPLILNASS